MEFDIQSVISALVAAGGGGAVIAYFLFKRLGDSWLEGKFAEKLEAFRHERAKELERLRAEIDGILRAKVRFQEKQFEACLEVWNALKDAQSKLLVSVSPLQQYSYIADLNEVARAEYLNTFDLPKWKIEEILSATDIQERFVEIMNRSRLSDANQAFVSLDRTTRANELFFTPKMFILIRSVLDKLHSSLVTKDLAIASSDNSFGLEAWTEYDKECIPLIKQLVSEMRELLDVR